MAILKSKQLFICVHYEVKENNIFSLKKDFLCFVDVVKTTSEALAILRALSKLSIDCDYFIGQGYDGTAAMKGCFNGVQVIISKKNALKLCASTIVPIH